MFVCSVQAEGGMGGAYVVHQMEVVVTAGAIKLQSNHHHQQTLWTRT